MVRTKFNGIPVEIPYEPYPPQLVTISKLIECFQTNTNALIESPTGTGKSLSILCSVLAFYEQEKRRFNEQNKPFKIFICSRTHKQIDQLIDQLRKTIYRPRITVLGSKNQYCINSTLSKVEDKNTACAELIKKKACVYFNGKDRLIKRIGEKIFDIEELKREGKKCAGCPYFTARELQEDADIIFAPYNYLIDTSVRESSEIKLDNAILIIDEAHNIEDCCRSAGSVEITSKLIEIVINELIGAIKRSALLGEVRGEFLSLMDIFRKLKDHSQTNEFDVKGKENQMKIRKGKEVIEELDKMGVGKEAFLSYKNSLQAIMKNEDAKSLLSLNTSRFLQEMERILGMVLFTGSEAYAYCFTKYKDEGYSYNLWLLDPSVMFLPLVSKIKSISLLSGTLTPFSSFCSELKFQFQHKLVAPHIIRTEQVFVASIRKGHLKQDLCGTYSTAETVAYLDQVSKIVVDIALHVKNEGGTLVFVPSYSFLNKLAGRISGAIVEPKDGGMVEFEKAIEAYKQRIQKKATSIFICVYRGKASEGVDFRDEYSRAVVAIGIPYPSIRDPQIGLKKEYNDKTSGYNGRLWYEAQAFRALNQALGRSIRHSNDWGSVFLIDSRYGEKRYQSGLPSWIVSNIKIFETYSQSVESFKSFIKSNTQEEKENIK
ncbi:uncharacterized protein VICG_01376 [Vittaforma corneae ATCC 50505]|uniref:DNA 5'-3' helicase n=1 Tax=Vittaforma corneae (strain ATCC 50505) TaxID=993615 RepID=L2GL84_VITCO|nr:uncharacterized protein VICG_01376 [Vittaforma corneae ATCC 50505]ELA41628.1 hypothetical protein VICG_01376 [Vittaforma corneae ATCC 50505]